MTIGFKRCLTWNPHPSGHLMDTMPCSYRTTRSMFCGQKAHRENNLCAVSNVGGAAGGSGPANSDHVRRTLMPKPFAHVFPVLGSNFVFHRVIDPDGQSTSIKGRSRVLYARNSRMEFLAKLQRRTARPGTEPCGTPLRSGRVL